MISKMPIQDFKELKDKFRLKTGYALLIDSQICEDELSKLDSDNIMEVEILFPLPCG